MADLEVWRTLAPDPGAETAAKLAIAWRTLAVRASASVMTRLRSLYRLRSTPGCGSVPSIAALLGAAAPPPNGPPAAPAASAASRASQGLPRPAVTAALGRTGSGYGMLLLLLLLPAPLLRRRSFIAFRLLRVVVAKTGASD